MSKANVVPVMQINHWSSEICCIVKPHAAVFRQQPWIFLHFTCSKYLKELVLTLTICFLWGPAMVRNASIGATRVDHHYSILWSCFHLVHCLANEKHPITGSTCQLTKKFIFDRCSFWYASEIVKSTNQVSYFVILSPSLTSLKCEKYS